MEPQRNRVTAALLTQIGRRAEAGAERGKPQAPPPRGHLRLRNRRPGLKP